MENLEKKLRKEHRITSSGSEKMEVKVIEKNAYLL
jgi:hypothetical protein